MAATRTAPETATLDTSLDDEASWLARVELAAVHRIVVLENMHEGTWNQFSCKVPRKPGHILLSPGQTHFSRVTASNLVELIPPGGPWAGTGGST